MNLYKDTIVAELYKEHEGNKIVWHKGFRQAMREALIQMNDEQSNVFGATFYLVDGTFLKEIHL